MWIVVQEKKDKQIISKPKKKLIGSWLALRSYEPLFSFELQKQLPHLPEKRGGK